MTHLIQFLTNIKQQNQVGIVTTFLIYIIESIQISVLIFIKNVMTKYVSRIIKNLNLIKINNKNNN